MGITTFSDISPRTKVKAARRFLPRGRAKMITEMFGQVDPQPKRSTMTRSYRRYNPLPLADTPLTEGVTPDNHEVTSTDVPIYLKQYGAWIPITDVIQDTHEDPVLMQYTDLLSEQAGETIEKLRLDFLRAGTNVYYANNAASRTAVASAPKVADFQRIRRQFEVNRAEKISNILTATMKVATEPIPSSFIVIGHVNAYEDLLGMPGFMPVHKYSESMKVIHEAEVGALPSAHMRFLLTDLNRPWMAAATGNSSQTTFLTNGAAGTGSADVYPMIVLARDSYAITPLAGESGFEIMARPPQTDKSDPLGQRGYVAWKIWHGGGILQDIWCARLEHAVTADPDAIG